MYAYCSISFFRVILNWLILDFYEKNAHFCGDIAFYCLFGKKNLKIF